MRRSIPLSRMRVLLRGPNCRVWFLGERIHSWRLGVQVRRPPLAPPRHMLWAHLLEGEELEQAFRDQGADELRERRRSQYSDFIHTRLLQRISFDATALVSLQLVMLFPLFVGNHDSMILILSFRPLLRHMSLLLLTLGLVP